MQGLRVRLSWSWGVFCCRRAATYGEGVEARKIHSGSCRAVWDRGQRTIKTLLRLYLALMGGLLIIAGGAQAQDYPNRAITVVVPFPPGGLTDVPARVFAAMLQ